MVQDMWVLPTYDRPERAQETLNSIMKAGCHTKGIVFVDGAKNPGYNHLKLPKGWELWRNEKNRGLCNALNKVFFRFPNLAWYGFLSDDSIVRTPNWDQKLLTHVDDFAIVHSDDGWQTHCRIHGAVLFGGELLRTLGWWVPLGLIHSFCDDVWETIAKKTGLHRFVPEVLVEHRHFWNGKAPLDASYLKAYATFDADKASFLKWKEKELEEILRRIYCASRCAQRKSILPREESDTSFNRSLFK